MRWRSCISVSWWSTEKRPIYLLTRIMTTPAPCFQLFRLLIRMNAARSSESFTLPDAAKLGAREWLSCRENRFPRGAVNEAWNKSVPRPAPGIVLAFAPKIIRVYVFIVEIQASDSRVTKGREPGQICAIATPGQRHFITGKNVDRVQHIPHLGSRERVAQPQQIGEDPVGRRRLVCGWKSVAIMGSKSAAAAHI